MRESIAFCSLILDDVPENLGMTVPSGISLSPNIPKFDSNCGEARLPVDVLNEWQSFDGIRFEESCVAFKDNIMDQMIILPGLVCVNGYLLMVLPLVCDYIHCSCSIWDCVTSVTYQSITVLLCSCCKCLMSLFTI